MKRLCFALLALLISATLLASPARSDLLGDTLNAPEPVLAVLEPVYTGTVRPTIAPLPLGNELVSILDPLIIGRAAAARYVVEVWDQNPSNPNEIQLRYSATAVAGVPHVADSHAERPGAEFVFELVPTATPGGIGVALEIVAVPGVSELRNVVADIVVAPTPPTAFASGTAR